MVVSHVEQLVMGICMSANPAPKLRSVAKSIRESAEWQEFVALIIDPDTLWTDVRPIEALHELFHLIR